MDALSSVSSSSNESIRKDLGKLADEALTAKLNLDAQKMEGAAALQMINSVSVDPNVGGILDTYA